MKVADDDLTGALTLLAQYSESNDITILQGRLSHWKQVSTRNILAPDELNRQRNQLRYAILELATQLP